jgi:hypothetical protein
MKGARVVLGSSLLAASSFAGPAFSAESDASAGSASTAPSSEESSSSLELSGAFGPSIIFGDPANAEMVQSFHRVGIFGEGAVAYRSKYFLDPFLSVGYASLASGDTQVPPGPYGAGGTLEQHLGAWTISPGITTDIWRFRPRLALGISVVVQKFGFNGEEHSSTQTPLVTQLGLGFNAYADRWFRVDIESRAILITGADVNFVTLDLVLRGDAIHF